MSFHGEPSAALSVAVQKLDDTVHLSLAGDLDGQTAEIFLDAIDWLCPWFNGLAIVDCSALRFVDARGLTAFLRARAALSHSGGALALLHPSSTLMRIVTATDLGAALPVIDPESARARGVQVPRTAESEPAEVTYPSR